MEIATTNLFATVAGLHVPTGTVLNIPTERANYFLTNKAATPVSSRKTETRETAARGTKREKATK